VFVLKSGVLTLLMLKTVQMVIDSESTSTGRIDTKRFDATGEKELAAQKAIDDAEARNEAARFVRRVRKRLGLSQAEFSLRIDIPIDTIRNWEQGKRQPTGAAKSLLKILDQAPETALRVLS
jgi:putative transcriptional regulator